MSERLYYDVLRFLQQRDPDAVITPGSVLVADPERCQVVLLRPPAEGGYALVTDPSAPLGVAWWRLFDYSIEPGPGGDKEPGPG